MGKTLDTLDPQHIRPILFHFESMSIIAFHLLSIPVSDTNIRQVLHQRLQQHFDGAVYSFPVLLFTLLAALQYKPQEPQPEPTTPS